MSISLVVWRPELPRYILARSELHDPGTTAWHLFTREARSLIAQFGTFEYALVERYRFEAELGRGAMGTVYRARDVRLDRTVAIKMLHATLTNELGVLRFQSEIRIAASLHHPNIVSVHDSGEADGRLFYVMDYLGGETLRARVERERQLSVDDALLIAEQVADGLQFAHDRGVVHRDIKPENILLADGRARVVDFGLARALGDVDTERLTASGLSVGTPQYLSPEQAAAEREVGPRADQYGLACVLYEMLVGEPPFTGPTATAVAMRHISEVPASLGKRRRTAPASVDAAVMRALEKVPADRFGSVKEFAAALRAPVAGGAVSVGAPAIARKKRLALPYVVGLGILTIAIVGMIGAVVVRFDDPIDNGVRWLTNRSLDTNRYVVLPFTSPANVAADGLDARLRDALSAWNGISIVDPHELQSVLGGKAGVAMTAGDVRSAVLALHAGRYVTGGISVDSAGLRIRAELLDAKENVPRRTASIVVPMNGQPSDSALAHLTYQLLFNGDEARRDEPAARGTKDIAAFESYLEGRQAMRTWNLVRADSALATALWRDGTFPQASLALAETRGWMSDGAPGIEGLVARAREGSRELLPAERTRLAALSDLAAGRFAQACSRYDSLVAVDSLDFAALYGIGECNRRDQVVIHDKTSESGHRFRGNYQIAREAYGRAFDLLPRLDECCEMRVDAVLRATLFATSPMIRFGHGEKPDSALYGAYPQLVDGKVDFLPRDIGELERPPPSTYAAALGEQQRLFYEIAARRVTQFPGNPDGLKELAEAMELLGFPAAVDTVRRARSLTLDPSKRLRLGAYEVWLRLKLAVPGQQSELISIRALAKSLLTADSHPDARNLQYLASLSVLVGEVDNAARFSERILPGPTESELPPDVYGTSLAFLVYAGAGGPADSLREFESRLTVGIANKVQTRDQSMVRQMLLSRGVGLAFPVYKASSLATLDTRTPLIAAEASFARGDTTATRRLLTKTSQRRTNIRPADITIDALYPEAWLRAATGDYAGALQILSPTLDALRFAPAKQFFDPAAAGSLIRAMSLRSELMNKLGDRDGARRWARAVRVLQPTPQRP